MVEDVLQSEAPKEDFGKRVLELLNVYAKGQRRFSETLAEIRKIGADGLDGFAGALELPHWQSRRFAAQMLTNSEQGGEGVVTLLKGMVNDPNKKVRKHSLSMLLLDVGEARKRDEFLPLLIPLLGDRSALVRRNAAIRLRPWAADVPLEAAARALAYEGNEDARRATAVLVLAVLDAREGDDA